MLLKNRGIIIHRNNLFLIKHIWRKIVCFIHDFGHINLSNSEGNISASSSTCIENKSQVSGSTLKNSPQHALEVSKVLSPSEYQNLKSGIAGSIVSTTGQDEVWQSYLERQSNQASKAGTTKPSSGMDELQGKQAIDELFENNYSNLTQRNKIQIIEN